jgi:hypothetical protein
MAVSAPFAVKVSIVRGTRAVSLYAAFSRKPLPVERSNRRLIIAR